MQKPQGAVPLWRKECGKRIAKNARVSYYVRAAETCHNWQGIKSACSDKAYYPLGGDMPRQLGITLYVELPG